MSSAELKREADSVIVREAAAHFADLLGATPGPVSFTRSRTGGWVADVEVTLIEDTKATFSVTLNSRGELLGYRRTGRSAQSGRSVRHIRGQADPA